MVAINSLSSIYYIIAFLCLHHCQSVYGVVDADANKIKKIPIERYEFLNETIRKQAEFLKNKESGSGRKDVLGKASTSSPKLENTEESSQMPTIPSFPESVESDILGEPPTTNVLPEPSDTSNSPTTPLEPPVAAERTFGLQKNSFKDPAVTVPNDAEAIYSNIDLPDTPTDAVEYVDLDPNAVLTLSPVVVDDDAFPLPSGDSAPLALDEEDKSSSTQLDVNESNEKKNRKKLRGFVDDDSVEKAKLFNELPKIKPKHVRFGKYEEIDKPAIEFSDTSSSEDGVEGTLVNEPEQPPKIVGVLKKKEEIKRPSSSPPPLPTKNTQLVTISAWEVVPKKPRFISKKEKQYNNETSATKSDGHLYKATVELPSDIDNDTDRVKLNEPDSSLSYNYIPESTSKYPLKDDGGIRGTSYKPLKDLDAPGPSGEGKIMTKYKLADDFVLDDMYLSDWEDDEEENFEPKEPIHRPTVMASSGREKNNPQTLANSLIGVDTIKDITGDSSMPFHIFVEGSEELPLNYGTTKDSYSIDEPLYMDMSSIVRMQGYKTDNDIGDVVEYIEAPELQYVSHDYRNRPFQVKPIKKEACSPKRNIPHHYTSPGAVGSRLPLMRNHSHDSLYENMHAYSDCTYTPLNFYEKGSSKDIPETRLYMEIGDIPQPTYANILPQSQISERMFNMDNDDIYVPMAPLKTRCHSIASDNEAEGNHYGFTKATQINKPLTKRFVSGVERASSAIRRKFNNISNYAAKKLSAMKRYFLGVGETVCTSVDVAGNCVEIGVITTRKAAADALAKAHESLMPTQESRWMPFSESLMG
uniref:Uncharacterized protein n=1 Tax=Babesia bovis TaxID=5865 RepID=A7AQG2_BABBO|eukprot:XP_001610349.1 hypothetical protein [Babesia bovis T2Bo]